MNTIEEAAKEYLKSRNVIPKDGNDLLIGFDNGSTELLTNLMAEFAEHCKTNPDYDYNKLPMNPNPLLPNWMNGQTHNPDLPSDEADIRAVLINYTDQIREYIRESHNLICFDERESEEFVDIFLQDNSLKPEPKEAAEYTDNYDITVPLTPVEVKTYKITGKVSGHGPNVIPVSKIEELIKKWERQDEVYEKAEMKAALVQEYEEEDGYSAKRNVVEVIISDLKYLLPKE